MRRVLALMAAGCVVAAGIVVGAPVVSAAPVASVSSVAAAPRVDWRSCADFGIATPGVECGYVSAPLDYAHPAGATIQLAVSRVKHTVPAEKYQGIMLVNPGGPGGSGVGLATLGKYVPKHAGDAYDWIGFDPRGVGSSKPALSCLPDYFQGPRPYYVPISSSLETTWLKRSKQYADACAAHQPELIKHLRTTDSAKDMETIRRAFGADVINYYGFSYGTYLGQVYSTLFPSRMRRMVLDGNVDPRGVWYKANLGQDTAFETTMSVWFGWLAKYDGVYHLGKSAADVRKLFFVQEQNLRSHPAGGVVGADEWDDIFLSAGYYQVVWLDMADVFAAWVHHHDTAALVSAYTSAEGPGDDNGFAIYSGVQCTDAAWPAAWSTWKSDAWRIDREAPFLTWGNTWFNTPCLYWHEAPGTPVNVNGGNVSALLVSEKLDAATPYEGSLEVRRRFPKSALIAEPGGTTHAGTLYGDACVDNKIADYLLTGALPERRAWDGADAFCAPLPQPDPTSAKAKDLIDRRPLARIRF